MSALAEKKIVVGVGGGIAAFKTPYLVRELGRRGAEVRVVMTAAATRFVGAITFAGLTGKPAVTDLFDPSYPGEVHVELGEWADAMVVAPATQNLLARAAHGFADDVVLATLACSRGPALFAPAMHSRMWTRSSTVRAMRLLHEDGAHFVGPTSGPLASGESGIGRMVEPDAIADALEALLSPKDLAGVTVLVTAGPTYEDLDPVRFVGNRSSGKMGFAIARRAVERGARVTLIAGPTELATPAGLDRVDVRSAREMFEAVMARGLSSDLVVMSAAVADFRPAAPSGTKLKKGSTAMPTIPLVENPDILATLGKERAGTRPVLVGFAVETGDLVRYARDKLARKRCDLVVANEASASFGRDDNTVVLVDAKKAEALEPMPKTTLADRILDRARELFER
jgi:phosphopantothenoylcysteine decarboxylase / phosphopantothenate---cysteine ligase